jgi:alpha/beta superfamily hydrolase
MDRLSTGIMIAVAALLMTGVIGSEALARDTSAGAPTPVGTIASPTPVANGPRSERVMSLLIALEALRAAPALLDASKV